MEILVLGGTKFVGRHFVEAALGQGHKVTIFNRGKTFSDLSDLSGLFLQVENLRGDRDGDLAALRGRYWDVVVDTSGYLPRAVRDSAELLAGSVERYVFVSSVSVYRDPVAPGTNEDSPIEESEDESAREVTPETYGGLKVGCERAVEESMPGKALIIRPGLIVGPHDPTERFSYWPRRVSEGGEILAPGAPEQRVQFLDVRDLAEWMVRMVEGGYADTYNVTGPAGTLTMEQFLEECRGQCDSEADLVWVGEEFLLERDVAPWTELPLWVPKELEGTQHIDSSKALDAGLTFRSVAETVAAVLEWERSELETEERGSALSRMKEAELLKAWLFHS